MNLDQEIYDLLAETIATNTEDELKRNFGFLYDKVRPFKVVGGKDDILREFVAVSESTEGAEGLEKVAKFFGRPSLIIQDGSFVEFGAKLELSKKIWGEILNANRNTINECILGVGRLDDRRDQNYGTGFLIERDQRTLIITNRHVINSMALGISDHNGNVHWEWNTFGDGKSKQFHIDFLQEHNRSGEENVELGDILYVSKIPSVDIAIVDCPKAKHNNLIKPLKVAQSVDEITAIGIIGYPSMDYAYINRIQEHAKRIFDDGNGNDVYGVKRLSPGRIRSTSDDAKFEHDCTTLPGSSGSPIIDIFSGEVFGVHFDGYDHINFANNGVVLNEAIDAALRYEEAS